MKTTKKGDTCPMCRGERTIWTPDGKKKRICAWCRGTGKE